MNGLRKSSELPEWGIPFPRPMATGAGLRIIEAGLPATLVLPLNQHIGATAKPLVTLGEQVFRGQPVAATATGQLGSRIHAPAAGVVTAIEPVETSAHGVALAIKIAVDDKNNRWNGYTPVPQPLEMTPRSIRDAILEAGIVGLGGAMFPTSVKLNPGSGISTLILNGAECEPQINCDDAIMRHQPMEILMGAQIMLRILEADECLIAIKQGSDAGSKTSAHTALAAALEELDDDRLRIALVPAIYPVGGEAQLIELLVKKEIPTRGLPWDTGVACQNVGTAAAITRFFATGEPLIRRIVTVTGKGVKNPANVIAHIGTPLAHVINCAGGYSKSASRLVLGGPMMGIAATSDAQPVTKATNCVYVAGASELSTETSEMPCIRCDDCAQVCPANLSPQLLLQAQRANNFENLQQLGLMDCIECGCCDYVCPSQIPLTRSFHISKHDVWETRMAHRRARQAEQRYSSRNQRLQERTEQVDTNLEKQLSGFANQAKVAPLDELKRRIAKSQSTSDKEAKD